MQIINPLYDIAFKYLMDNNRLAKKVLSVILDEEITELVVGQQESTIAYNTLQLTLYRLDFRATIRQTDGSLKTVLVELQKSKFPSDIQRFRNYLASSYMTREQEPAVVKEPLPGMLPIVTIYILGYNLDDLPYLAVTVNNEVINSVNRQRVEVKSFFVEHLTHRAHIIQVRRLPQERRTRLEQFLTLFNQAWCTSNQFIIDLKEVPDEFADIAAYLQGPTMNEDFRRNMSAERELDVVFGQQAKEMEELRRQVLQAQKEAEKLKEEAQKEKEEAEKKNFILTRKWIQSLQQQGLSLQEIAHETGIDEMKINNYL